MGDAGSLMNFDNDHNTRDRFPGPFSLHRKHDPPTMSECRTDSECSSRDVRDVVPSILRVNPQWATVTKTKTPCYFPDPNVPQRPKLLWIGCSDSRILEGDITVARPGEIFVHRNIANQFPTQDTNALAVLAYAIGALGVRNVAVVGHKKCGGVIYAHEQAQPCLLPERICLTEKEGAELFSGAPGGCGDVSSDNPIYSWLEPLIQRLKQLWPGSPGSVEWATMESVQLQVENLLSLRQTILKLSGNQPVLVHGLLYDFTTGILENLVPTSEIKP